LSTNVKPQQPNGEQNRQGKRNNEYEHHVISDGDVVEECQDTINHFHISAEEEFNVVSLLRQDDVGRKQSEDSQSIHRAHRLRGISGGGGGGGVGEIF
jgi:hypothetical protein